MYIPNLPKFLVSCNHLQARHCTWFPGLRKVRCEFHCRVPAWVHFTMYYTKYVDTDSSLMVLSLEGGNPLPRERIASLRVWTPSRKPLSSRRANRNHKSYLLLLWWWNMEVCSHTLLISRPMGLNTVHTIWVQSVGTDGFVRAEYVLIRLLLKGAAWSGHALFAILFYLHQ